VRVLFSRSSVPPPGKLREGEIVEALSRVSDPPSKVIGEAEVREWTGLLPENGTR
jgi:hypothetical protein